jgi:hypothetical protein
LFYINRWGCPHKSNFFPFAMSQLDQPIAKKKCWNYGSSPKIEDSMERWWSVSPFGPGI